MKQYVKSSQERSSNSQFLDSDQNTQSTRLLNQDQDVHLTFYHGRKKFAANLKMIDYPEFSGNVYQPHPYDDAEYTTAVVGRRGAMNVEFVRDRKVIDRMQFHYYEDFEEDYERPEDYIDDVLDQIAVEILRLDKDVKPRMMYN